jgi:uncharacterized membrane protein
VDATALPAPQLRPLGVGDIVDRVFALYRAQPVLFLAIATVPYLALVLAIAGLGLAFATSFIGLINVVNQAAEGRTPDISSLAAGMAAFITFALAVVLVAIVVLSAQSAALIAAFSDHYLGRRTTVSEAFRTGLRAAPSLIGASLLLFALLVALWIVLAIAMAVTQHVLVIIAAIVGGMVATIYLAASALVAPVVVTIEHAGPAQALRRSWALSEGNRWRILGLQLLLTLLNGVISVLLSTIFVTTLISDPNARAIGTQIVNLVANIAWTPVQWGTFAILYYDLRVRREAFDLSFAAEALPRQV